MRLCVSTNKVGSMSDCDLGITKKEWEELSEEDQNDLIQEYLWNVIDVWVEED